MPFLTISAMAQEVWNPGVNMGPVVNSPLTEKGSDISADGLTLYFHHNTPQGDINIFYSEWDGSAWGPPIDLGVPVNSVQNDYGLSVTTDGNKLYFTRDEPAGYGGFDLYTATRDATGDACTSAATVPALVTVQTSGPQHFVVRVTGQALLDQMIEICLGNSPQQIVLGDLLTGNGGYNQDSANGFVWSWHLDEETIALAEFTIELCDGSPSFVEAELEYWIETVGSFCPWSSQIVAVAADTSLAGDFDIDGDVDVDDATLLQGCFAGSGSPCYNTGAGCCAVDMDGDTDIRTSYQASVINDHLSAVNAHTDAYRAHLGDSDYSWGSNRTKSLAALLFNAMNRYGLDPDNASAYRSAATGYLHYLHGVNPMGFAYLTNMGEFGAERSLNEMYHGWFHDGSDWDNAETSLYGPAPGYVTGGANPTYQPDAAYQGPPIEPPMNQPIQKSYRDWNTSWPENSWEVTECHIPYQAAYLRLLAEFTACSAAFCLGDFDNDGDVDQTDVDQFETCFTGPGGGPIAPQCGPGDWDEDDDVACDDWNHFKLAWTAPGDPPTIASCSPNVPTVSDWGMAAMTLLVLTAATVVYCQRFPAWALRTPRCGFPRNPLDSGRTRRVR